MEFNKFLFGEKSSSSSTPPALHSSSRMGEHAFQVGYVPTDSSQASDKFSNTSNPRATFLQELEMHRVKEQMVAAEVKRRLQIEEEVRREMVVREAVEREMALRGANIFNNPILSAPWTMMSHGLSVFNHFKGGLVDAVLFTRKPEGIVTNVKTSPEVKNKIINDLPKEHANISGLKRKAQSPLPPTSSDILPLATKQPSCELCDISTTSEEQLKRHLQGKKHKGKELKKPFKTNVIGFGSKFAINDRSKEVLKHDEEQSNSVMQRVRKILEDVRDDGMASKKVETKGLNYPYWCVVCGTGTLSMKGMDAHLNGKKHKSMLFKDIA